MILESAMLQVTRPHLEWKRLLHHYYNPFPKMKHFTRIKIDA